VKRRQPIAAIGQDPDKTFNAHLHLELRWEWSNDGPRHLSWGCVVLHLYDISKVFDQIPRGAMAVIF